MKKRTRQANWRRKERIVCRRGRNGRPSAFIKFINYHSDSLSYFAG